MPWYRLEAKFGPADRRSTQVGYEWSEHEQDETELEMMWEYFCDSYALEDPEGKPEIISDIPPRIKEQKIAWYRAQIRNHVHMLNVLGTDITIYIPMVGTLVDGIWQQFSQEAYYTREEAEEVLKDLPERERKNSYIEEMEIIQSKGWPSR